MAKEHMIMNTNHIIECLKRFSVGCEIPPDCLSMQDVKAWMVQQYNSSMEDALLHEGLIEEYAISPNVIVKRMTYRGQLELARLTEECARNSFMGKIKRYGWYVITAVASSVMTILTTWVMKKLGL